MKDNKLIAEFMGVKPIVLGGSTEYEMYGVLDCIEDGVDEKHFFIDDEMRFQESWDWLMPVAEKCLEKHNNLIDGRNVIDTSYTSIAQALQVVSLKETYKAVVEFIKTYNNDTI